MNGTKHYMEKGDSVTYGKLQSGIQFHGIDIDKDGNVYVDGNLLNEPYVREKAFGECDIDLPYQVPDESIFVMGDHRLTSVDSRSSSVGAVLMEDVAGKIIFRVWPLSEIGKVNILE